MHNLRGTSCEEHLELDCGQNRYRFLRLPFRHPRVKLGMRGAGLEPARRFVQLSIEVELASKEILAFSQGRGVV